MPTKDLLFVILKVYGILLSHTGKYTDKAIVKYCLLHKMSYRLPDHAKTEKLIGFRVFLRVCRKTLLNRINYKRTEIKKGVAILDLNYRFYDLEVNYIAKQSLHRVELFIGKEYMNGFFAWYEIPLKLILLLLFLPPFVVAAFFSSNRVNLALLITEIPEIANLLTILKKNKINTLYDFIPYEKDGNLLSYLLNHNNISVVKLPSPGPLYLHNSLLLGSKLILSNQYQYEEYEKFKLEGVKIKDTEKWLPEFAFEYIDKYISPHLDTSAALNKIAYYSHGSWIRKKQNHAKNKLTIFEDEQKILNFLNTYIQRYPELSLSIYTHPRERKEEFRQEAQRFYKQHLPDITFSFPENDKKTADCFNEADIAICAYSSVIYERLFCGFKTLVGLPATSGFPMKESKLNNIVFKSYAEMEEKINFSRLLPAKQFFESYQLKGYAFYDYPYFKTHEYQ